MSKIEATNNATQLATSIALRMLGSANSSLSFEHREQIFGTCELLLRAAFGVLDGRYIIGLPTGAGKSTCAAASLFSLHEIGELENAPVMVLAEQINAGEELVDLLLSGYGERTGREEDRDTGIDSALISHVHGDVEGDDPADADLTPIVIATHKRSRMTKDVTRLLRYKGHQRGAWIDEGMLASEAFGLTLDKAEAALSRVSREAETSRGAMEHRRLQIAERLDNEKEHEKAIERREALTETERETLALQVWAGEAGDALYAAKVALQRRTVNEVGELHLAVTLPEPKGFDLDLAIKAIKSTRVSDHADRLLEAAKASPESFTLIGNRTQLAILQHRRVLPKAMDRNTVILDAGASVDEIQLIDPGLKTVDSLPWWPRDSAGVVISPASLKSWEGVTIYHMDAPGGRSSFEKTRHYLADMVEATARLLADEIKVSEGDEVVICTYVSCERSLKKLLGKELRHRLMCPVVIGGDVRPSDDNLWVRVLHYGEHHSTNRYRNANVIVGLGDYPISRDDLKALIVGQQNIMHEGAASELGLNRYLPDSRRLTEAMGHWCAKGLLQLAGRGRARQVVDGKAEAMVFAFVSERLVTVEDLHKVAMPGSTLKKWRLPESVQLARENQLAGLTEANTKKAENGRTQAAADLIAPRLRKYRDEREGPSSVIGARNIRQILKLPTPQEGLDKYTLRDALQLVIRDNDWIEVATKTDGREMRPRTLILHADELFEDATLEDFY